MNVAFPDVKPELGAVTNPTMNWFYNAPATTDQEGKLLDPAAQALEQAEASSGEPWPEVVRENATLLTRAGLWPGEDFLVIKYAGRPKTAEQNAANAYRHGAKGVEPSAIAKSYAGLATLESGEESLVILTGPSDLEFKTSGILAGQKGELRPAGEEDLESLGFEHGTVGPIGALFARTGDSRAIYLFDKDFIDRDARDPDKKVYVSGGDPAWSIALDIRKLMTAANQCAPFHIVSDICDRGAANERIFARSDITLISGDSALVGSTYQGLLEELVRMELLKRNAYFGDESMPNLDLLSRHAMGGTGSVATHAGEVTDYIERVIKQIPEGPRKRLLAFTSNAANLGSIAGAAVNVAKDRPDLRVVTTEDALEGYIDDAKPGNLVVFGLPEVIDQYPDSIGSSKIVKGNGKDKISEWMQAARSAKKEELGDIAKELKRLIIKSAKLEMANCRGLDGREKGEFMKNPDIEVEGTVVLAGTELWKILDAGGIKEGSEGFEKIKLIDPITLLMQRLASLALARS